MIKIRCLTRCKFTEFGRDRAYFDFDNLHQLNKYHLNVASGYKASMDIYGSKTLLCSELCHKLINVETVWDLMQRMYRDYGPSAYKEKVTSYLVGLTVMTNYNNKTYRIDDINWDADPTSTFELKRGGGDKVSFINYYNEHYKIKIRESKQPLLVSRVRLRPRPPQPGAAAAAAEESKSMEVLLVPELCVLTGLSML